MLCKDGIFKGKNIASFDCTSQKLYDPYFSVFLLGYNTFQMFNQNEIYFLSFLTFLYLKHSFSKRLEIM